jgi:hypothetical protein
MSTDQLCMLVTYETVASTVTAPLGLSVCERETLLMSWSFDLFF